VGFAEEALQSAVVGFVELVIVVVVVVVVVVVIKVLSSFSPMWDMRFTD